MKVTRISSMDDTGTIAVQINTEGDTEATIRYALDDLFHGWEVLGPTDWFYHDVEFLLRDGVIATKLKTPASAAPATTDSWHGECRCPGRHDGVSYL